MAATSSVFHPCMVQQLPRKKWKLPIAFIIQRWLDTNDNTVLENCTFRYIVNYFNGCQPDRLKIALYDFGYTLRELEILQKEGKTARDIALEIVSRTEEQPDSDADDDYDD